MSPDPTPNYIVTNGSLWIFPVPNTTLTKDYRHINTDGIYWQTYGYFEIEARLPHGKGPWPAFWLLNHDQSVARPEIDIMEAYPGGGPNSGWSDANLNPTAYAATVYVGDAVNARTQVGHQVLQTTDLSADYHKYALKWDPNQQTFYFDGVQFFTLNVTIPDRMFILLSYQFGSASGQPDSTTPLGLSNAFAIRYIRAWQVLDQPLVPSVASPAATPPTSDTSPLSPATPPSVTTSATPTPIHPPVTSGASLLPWAAFVITWIAL